MIHFEDTQLRVGIAMGESIEARTKKNVLSNALHDRAGDRVFGIAAAGDEERAKADGEGTVGTRWSAAQFFRVGVAEDRDSNRVVENKRPRVVKLVRGAAQGYAECGS